MDSEKLLIMFGYFVWTMVLLLLHLRTVKRKAEVRGKTQREESDVPGSFDSLGTTTTTKCN